MSKTKQIGPSLFWTPNEPKAGATFSTGAADYTILEVTPDPESGGFLFTVQIDVLYKHDIDGRRTE